MARTPTPEESDEFQEKLKELSELVEANHTPTVDPWGRDTPTSEKAPEPEPEEEEDLPI